MARSKAKKPMADAVEKTGAASPALTSIPGASNVTHLKVKWKDADTKAAFEIDADTDKRLHDALSSHAQLDAEYESLAQPLADAFGNAWYREDDPKHDTMLATLMNYLRSRSDAWKEVLTLRAKIQSRRDGKENIPEGDIAELDRMVKNVSGRINYAVRKIVSYAQRLDAVMNGDDNGKTRKPKRTFATRVDDFCTKVIDKVAAGTGPEAETARQMGAVIRWVRAGAYADMQKAAQAYLIEQAKIAEAIKAVKAGKPVEEMKKEPATA